MVYKKATEDNFISIGQGKIQIEETFFDLFRVSLPQSNIGAATLAGRPENIYTFEMFNENIDSLYLSKESPSTMSDPVEFPITEVHKAWFPLVEAANQRKSKSIIDICSDDGSCRSGAKAKQIGVVLLRLRITCFGSNMVAPLQYGKSRAILFTLLSQHERNQFSWSKVNHCCSM